MQRIPAVVPELTTERLRLRPWRPDDAADVDAALGLYGDERVVRWLSPAMRQVPGTQEMRDVLDGWASAVRSESPAGHWAVEAADDGRFVGAVALRQLPPDAEDLELSYQVLPAEQGRGFAVEAARRVVRAAFSAGEPELFVVARSANTAGQGSPAGSAQWVGETSKYYDLRLQVFRLRPADLT